MMEQSTLAMPAQPAATPTTGRAGAWWSRLVGSGWRLGFGLVLVCFFLPFFTVSCQGQPLASVRGVELVTGATLDPITAQGQPVSDEQRVTVPREPWALVAALAAVGGLVTGLARVRWARALAGLAAALGLVALVLLRDQALRLANARASVGVTIAPESGYWLALAGFLLAGLLALTPLVVGWLVRPRAVNSPGLSNGMSLEPLEDSDRRSVG